MQRRFDKAQVDYLVAERKYIKELPPIGTDVNYRNMWAEVFRKSDGTPYKGKLVVSARVPIPVGGVPAGIPGTALLWHGFRIRGIDKHVRYDNPDGSLIRGWHEHLWSTEFKDAWVRSAPEPKHKDMRGIFRAALKMWNIEIEKDQMEVEGIL